VTAVRASSSLKGLWANPWLRIAIGLVAFVAVTIATVKIAVPRMHVILTVYDDEGYMLTALNSFVDRGSLYDEVFSQYGPFYFGVWGGLFSTLGIPVDHEHGRVVTGVVWVGSSLALGLATWWMTRSAFLGVGVQALCFSALIVLGSEPMHAGGMVTLLLAAIVCIACFVGRGFSPWPLALLGGALAALILTKVNVGGFALVALALVCAYSYPVISSRRWPRVAVEVGFVALPILLMSSKLGEDWVRQYAFHVSIAALAIVIALRARSDEARQTEELWWIGGGLLAVGLTSCLAILGSGTSPGGLIEGVLLQPLQQDDAFSLQLPLADSIWIFDAVALIGVIAYWAVRRRGGAPGPLAQTALWALVAVIGLEIALSVIGRTVPWDSLSMEGHAFSFLAFAWVALIPAPAGARTPAAFARLLLPPLAVLQALHAFPVAGSQMMWSTFLLIPVGAICVANGVSGIAATLPRSGRLPAAAVGLAAAVALAVHVGNATLRDPLDEARFLRDTRVPLGLPGAESLRMGPEEVDVYNRLVAAIDRRCPAFVTEPGMGSFYVWSQQEPPTGQNATAWMTLFDDERQRQVIEDTRRIKGLCLVRNELLVQAWTHGKPAEGPLARYLDRGFTPITEVGGYELLQRDVGAGRAG
jgi:hypothetical protein